MKKLILTLALTGLVFAQTLCAQTYDRGEVIKVMRQNVTLLNGVKADLGASKLTDAADKFYQFAKGQSSILIYTPPKGTKTEWDRINGAFVTAALKGVASSLANDKIKAQAALDELLALNKEGHGTFR